MVNSFYHLQYSYYRDLEHYLIIYSDSGIRNDELAEVQVKMMQSNSIPRMLSVEVEEIDLLIKLRYKIGSTKSLSHVLKEQKLTTTQYYRLLHQIIQTIEDSKFYMLSEQNYVLDKNFIYIGKDIEDVYLIYLPFKSIQKEETLQNELKKIIIDLYHEVNQVEGDSFQILFDYVNQVHFTVLKLKELVTLIINPDPLQVGTFEKMESQKGNIVLKNNMNVFKMSELRPFSDREKILLYGSAIILIAFLWKIYLNYQTEGLLYINIGLSIAIGDIVLILQKLWRPTFHAFTKNKVDQIQRNIAPNPYEKKSSTDVFTSIIQNDETVWLSSISEKKINRAYFEFAQGDRKKIVINKDRFLIGRSVNEVDYLIDSKGISRKHVEIFEGQNGYILKDLGSKNGTFINGNRLIPNKNYSLGNGDIILLGEIEIIYKVEGDMVIE